MESPRLETEAWTNDRGALCFCHNERQWHLVSGQNGHLQSPSSEGSNATYSELFHTGVS